MITARPRNDGSRFVAPCSLLLPRRSPGRKSGASPSRILILVVIVLTIFACASTPKSTTKGASPSATSAEPPAGSTAATAGAGASASASGNQTSTGANESAANGSGPNGAEAATAGNTEELARQAARISALESEVQQNRDSIQTLQSTNQRLVETNSELTGILQKVALASRLGSSSAAQPGQQPPATQSPLDGEQSTSSGQTGTSNSAQQATTPQAGESPSSTVAARAPQQQVTGQPSTTNPQRVATDVRGTESSTLPATATPIGTEPVPGSILIVSQLDSSGDSVYVDVRANVLTGTGAYLEIVPGPAPQLRLVAQYRLPESAAPFDLQAVEVGAGDGSVSITRNSTGGADAVVSSAVGSSASALYDRFRMTPFTVEQLVVSNQRVVVRIVNALLSAARPEISFKGSKTSLSYSVNPDQTDALSNVLYAFRELGGSLPR